LNLRQKARERGLDFSYRPRADGVDTRLWVLGRSDIGRYKKGVLAGSGVDFRDPTSDRRLIEYCLRVPLDQYLRNGVPRSLVKQAFAGLLPRAVLEERRRGLQAIDWHEGLTAARAALSDELGRLKSNDLAARTLDVARLDKLEQSWPQGGWDHPDVVANYRLALLRGVSAGHFLRKASGGNM
jgi:asparagine synthase (glutamine-hydrolysing)